MVFILTQNVEVSLFKNGPDSRPGNLVEKYKGAVALDWAILVSDFVAFPIANHGAYIIKISLYKLSKDDYKTVCQATKADVLPILKRQRCPVLELDGHVPPQLDPKGWLAVCEMDIPGQRQQGLPPGKNSHQVVVKFSDEKPVKQWADFESEIRNNRHLQVGDGSYGKPVPRCRVCGRYKALGGVYGCNRTDGAPVRPWEREFMCPTCMGQFAALVDHLRREAEKSMLQRGTNPLLCDLALKLATDALDDPLAIATAKTYKGMVSDDARSVPLLEEARAFLSHFDDEDVKASFFHDSMESVYQQNMYFLGQRYSAAREYEKALVLLQEGLEYDEREGNQLNVAKSKSSLGSLYMSMGQVEKAEALLVDSLKSRKQLGADLVPPLLSLVQLYMMKPDRENLAKYTPELKSRLGNAAFQNQILRDILANVDHVLAGGEARSPNARKTI